MGQFKNNRYYRGKNDPELQWLEDGANLLGKTLCHSVFLLFSGILEIIAGVITLLNSRKTD